MNNHINDNTLKSALIYQFLHFHYHGMYISVSDVIKKHPNIGFTYCLIKCVRQLNTIIRDGFGKYYNDYITGPGYCYNKEICDLSHQERSSPFSYYFSGILFCLINKINI